ncbi:ADP-heptose--LPS heptosyltransferase [Clostridium beijerinckii]|uniref:ADP-heptose--LPS heptosyltransferase n=1 Tax=Clostridium beijerinckii TaxID=1520 RepID=UPI00156E2889|nr:ADP-heptose--LPS heptosyltransferase [Clostridium beijerinckii]NRT73706.1 hypothetical protein [Clostridium beijerinckii]
MNSKYIDEMTKNIDTLISNNKLKGKFIVVFGANKPAEKAILYLNSREIYVNAVIDNDKSKFGKKMLGIKIYAPEQLLDEFNENACILIASQYYQEMKSQLENMKYKEYINIFEIVKYKHCTAEKEYFDEKISDVLKGYDVFKNIQKKYGRNKTILICPYRGIGDIYFICSYIDGYLEKNGIKDYVFAVIGNSCKRVATIFEIKNIEALDQNEADKLVDFSRIIETKENPIKILSHNYVHTDILDKFEINKQLSWGELFKNCIMSIDKNTCKKNPLLSFRKKYIEDLFEKNSLVRGKTVIISPYANTIVRLEDGFWEKIVEKLNEKGFKVCTNSIGEEEPPIVGSIPLNFPLEDAVSVVEYAGTFIGIRSGFCDLISSSKAKKIVLYPNENSFFFSIKDMGLSDDIIEIMDKKVFEVVEKLIC